AEATRADLAPASPLAPSAAVRSCPRGRARVALSGAGVRGERGSDSLSKLEAGSAAGAPGRLGPDRQWQAPAIVLRAENRVRPRHRRGAVLDGALDGIRVEVLPRLRRSVPRRRIPAIGSMDPGGLPDRRPGVYARQPVAFS